MTKRLKDRVAVITGAGSGIGKAIAMAYAREGAKVCCLSLNEDKARMTAEAIISEDNIALTVACDVRDYHQLRACFHKVNNDLGSLDILVINAGVDIPLADVETRSIDDWSFVFDVNLNGAFYTAKAAIPIMKEKSGGKIIVMGSELGHRGTPNKSAYCCSKAGLKMLVKVMAQELFEAGIAVNEIIPGRVKTMIGIDEGAFNKLDEASPLEWVKEPEEVTELAIFLAGQPDIGPTGQTFSLMRHEI